MWCNKLDMMYDPVGPASVEAQESYGNDKDK